MLHLLCRRPLFCLLAALLLLPGISLANDTLRVLAWPGYADPDLVKAFEQRHKVRVEVSFVDTDDALWKRISKPTAAAFDVFAVNTAELQRYIAAALVLPIDIAALPQRARQLPRFQNLAAIPGIVHHGKVYAIPYTYAEMGLIYDRAQITQPPESISALWDPRYRGKVLAYNGGSHNFALAAQSLGRKTPFRLDDKDWPLMVERLIALRRNVLAFYTQPEESVTLFTRHQAALLFANYGSQQFKMLKNAGVDVGYVIPREGALAWLDCWVIAQGARNRTLAHAWIDFMLEAEAGKALLERQGLANTRSPSPFHQPEDRLLWLEPVENPEQRYRYWQRIISGEQARKVLAP